MSEYDAYTSIWAWVNYSSYECNFHEVCDSHLVRKFAYNK